MYTKKVPNVLWTICFPVNSHHVRGVQAVYAYTGDKLTILFCPFSLDCSLSSGQCLVRSCSTTRQSYCYDFFICHLFNNAINFKLYEKVKPALKKVRALPVTSIPHIFEGSPPCTCGQSFAAISHSKSSFRLVGNWMTGTQCSPAYPGSHLNHRKINFIKTLFQ